LTLEGHRFETLGEITQALNDGPDYWNKHCHPHYWEKPPQNQVTLLGGFGVQIWPDSPSI